MASQHITDFTTLVARSTKLLHNHEIDIKSLALEATAASPPDEKSKVAAEESDEESEDDDDLFGMLGAYESSEDEVEEETAGVEEELEDDDEEDEVTLLKRASAVHSALLLSLDSTAGKEIDFSGLIDAIIARATNKSSDSSNELATVLSYTISPSTFDTRPKSFRGSQQRWNKVCYTNALCAIQFLLHLMPSPSSVLAGWNAVVLPLLLGNKGDVAHISLLMKNDRFREAVLNLTAVYSSGSIENEISKTCSVCLGAIREATFSVDMTARQKKIDVVCSVLIHLFDNIPRLSKCATATLAELRNVASETLHQAVLIILRGICYETVECNGDDVKVQPPLLSVEALRIITGMLLLKLYPHDTAGDAKLKNGGGASKVDDKRAVELWCEMLMLLSPYSLDVVEDSDAQGKRRRCKNWNYAAPLSATAILCVILPACIVMELPTISRVKDDTNSNNRKWEVNKELCSRPGMQLCLWDLLRTCLGRSDDSPNFTGRSGEGGDGGGRGTSLLSQKKSSFATDAEDDARPMDDAPTDQLLRRRSAHCVRLLVEYERERLKRESSGKKEKQRGAKGKGESTEVSDSNIEGTEAWMKYVLVFEMLEMEIELHLVDQVWPTMKELASIVVDSSLAGNDDSQLEILTQLPQLRLLEISALLKRVLLSEAPTLRKLGLYRFLRGDSGVDVNIPTSSAGCDNNVVENTDNNVFMNRPKSKYKIKKDTGGDAATLQPAPLSSISVDFVLDVVIVSYDSIIGTKVGTNMQIDEDGTLKSESITPLLSSFLSNYAVTLAMVDGANTHRLGGYINQVFGPNLAKGTKPRSLVTYFRAAATALESISAASLPTATLEPITVRETIKIMLAEFSSGGAPRSLQDTLKRDLALALQHTTPWQNPDASLVLQVLALYPPEESTATSTDVSLQQIARVALTAWLKQLGNGKWAANAISACCSAYVMGDLMPFNGFDWIAGVNIPEREMGQAMCTLAALLGNASETLWPAVFKGLQNVPPVDSTSASFCKANRSMILLEFGCRESVLSGMGNGDLVADKNKQMLPPPPQIDGMLHNALSFVLSQLTRVSRTLVSATKKDAKAVSGANRSSEANNVSYHLAMLIAQVTVLHHSFPSSVSVSLVVNNTLKNTVDLMTSGTANVVESRILLYAALSCGAEFGGKDSLCQITRQICSILGIDFSAVVNGLNARKDTKQALRSIFQYVKWGCLSLLIPMLIGKDCDAAEATFPSISDLSQKIIQVAQESVAATPVIALQPLFQSVVAAEQNIIALHSALPSEDNSKDLAFLTTMQTTISTLFAILDEENISSTWMYMLHEICKLIFQPTILREEYEMANLHGKSTTMPVLSAFDKLLKMGGTTKSHICKTAVSFISTAWLGEEGSDDIGILAIPYRQHIVDLLVYKEGKIDESAAHQAFYQNIDGPLPYGTNVSSITRGFVLVFLSKLKNSGVDSVSKTVLVELVEFVIDGLLDIGCAGPAVGKPFITGSEEYARATRSWQALCLLNNFITDEKAQVIAPRVFKAMSNNTHGPVRFFMEVFSIQCIRKHPDVFGGHFIREINRADLSLQYVSSLMVLGGNAIVGKYSSAFFQNSSEQRIKDVLCGVIPWLSSTQGFARAIAQLLVHKLIPLIVNVSPDVDHGDKSKDSAVFASIYSFLENNGEMSRLRAKQQNFFGSYDVDSACSLEGLLSIPVDEGEEANPLHLVEAIKDCLAEVYSELHEEDAPLWKQMEDLTMNEKQAHTADAREDDSAFHDAELVNFQRKILPIDALDLKIQSIRDQKLFNAAGKRKQNLIICATLVDKVPNLAGLARTAEIFSAQTLVIPNLSVKKQDDFKTISASANDWIEMEECKTEELLNWLYQKKSQGYTIVGLEQTSSSKCITKFRFPEKTVLLLGKEKEGIPVEFLSAVDQCIEIPQLGIIRSLNVHVTGAIAIWKFTEQMLQKNKKKYGV